MTRALAIQWETIQNAIHRWACDATEIDWLWAFQDTAQTPYPFGVISIVTGPTKLGLDDIRWLPPGEGETNGKQAHAGPREFVLGFQVSVGEPDSNARPDMGAESILSTLQATVGFEATRAVLFPAHVAIVEELPIQSLDLFIGSDHISRAQMDVRFLTHTCIEETVAPIDEVEITAEITDHPAQGGTDTIDLGG